MPQHSAHPSPSAHMGAGSPLSTDSMRPPTTPRYSFKGFPEVADLAATHAPLRLCFGSAAHSRPGDSPGVQARNNIIILFQLLCMFEEFFVPEGNECWIWDVIRSEWALDLGLEELTPVRVKLIATVFRASFDVSFYWRHFRAGYREDQPGGSSREPDLEACDELLLQLVSKWIGFRRSHSTKTRRADDRSSEMLRLVSRITQWRSELSEHRDDLLRTQIAAPREVADHIHGDGRKQYRRTTSDISVLNRLTIYPHSRSSLPAATWPRQKFRGHYWTFHRPRARSGRENTDRRIRNQETCRRDLGEGAIQEALRDTG